MCLAKVKAEMLASECDSTSGIPRFTVTKSVHSLDVMDRSYFFVQGYCCWQYNNPTQKSKCKRKQWSGYVCKEHVPIYA